MDVIVLGDSEGPDMIQGIILIRNGSKNEEISSWVIEIDETLTVRKLFTPKDDVIATADDARALDDKEVIVKKRCNTLKVQKNTVKIKFFVKLKPWTKIFTDEDF
jgi:hypothetical protein